MGTLAVNNSSYEVYVAREHLPKELRREVALLVLSEGGRAADFPIHRKRNGEIYTDYPIPLQGIPDQVYRRKADKKLIVVDTKARKSFKVYPADKLQLSIYAYILHYGYNLPVENYGYIRLEKQGLVRYVKTKLHSFSYVEKRFSKYQQLTNNLVTPCKTASRGLCRHCDRQKECRILHNA